MGDLDVKQASGGKKLKHYTQNLLTDVRALDKMLKDGIFDIETTRIGAEQEMCLIHNNWKPANVNLAVLETARDSDFTSELAQFNIEINFDPLVFEKDCLSRLEAVVQEKIGKMRQAAMLHNSELIYTGILPTIRKYDLNDESLTPLARYKALMNALRDLRGEDYELKINGVDELNIKHETALLEACNTGFQIHMQIKPDEFSEKYNIAQAIAGPTLSCAVNSPLLFGKRLWHETRIALFQQSVDTRTTSQHLREHSPRVNFGNKWVEESILELYKEDIVRFRIILGSDFSENSLELYEQGITPSLKALTVHNSTVYRWNRPCYGIKDNIPHIRIENRVLPAGPTVVDEVANSALWFGLMNGFTDAFGEAKKVLNFDDVKNNFFIAAQTGIHSKFKWVNGKTYQAEDLILKSLVPVAREGLKKANIASEDIDKYLGIIEERTKSGQTGSAWMLNSFESLSKTATLDETVASITAVSVQNQKEGLPVHKWKPIEESEIPYWEPSSILVEEFMTRDIFTVRKDDIIELAIDMMDWEKIRYIAVEDSNGKLVGLVTSRILLRHLRHNYSQETIKETLVKDIMITKPISISPYADIIDAINIMNTNTIGCLPVVKKGKLVGIVTEQDSLKLSGRLFQRLSKK
jgi:CBS domain-containing protein/gamma-glutamylcysteine synthetase